MSSMTVPLQSANTASSTTDLSTRSQSSHCSNKKKELTHNQLPSNTDDITKINSSFTPSNSTTKSSCGNVSVTQDKKHITFPSTQMPNKAEDDDKTEVTIVAGVPSPTWSETSDHQRSTSTSEDGQDSIMGKLITAVFVK